MINQWICSIKSWNFEFFAALEKKKIQYLRIFYILNYNFFPCTKVTFSGDFILSDRIGFTVLKNYFLSITSFLPFFFFVKELRSNFIVCYTLF